MSHGGKREGSGRPAGAPNEKLQKLRALFEPHTEELIAKAVEIALEGDIQALRLCLERVLPAMKSREEPIAIHITGDTLAEKAEAVLELGESGELCVSDLSALMQMVSTMARIIDIDELEARIAALEENRE